MKILTAQHQIRDVDKGAQMKYQPNDQGRSKAGGHLPPVPPSRPAASLPISEEQEPTLAKACDARVREATSAILWRTYGHPKGITKEQIKSDLWQSDEGRQLTALSRSKWRAMPRSKALAAIQASPDREAWVDALRVLRDGMPVGR
jgi:hypothetical protein